MSSFKEIVTKAIIGKGKKQFNNTYNVDAEGATNVLGCWVINHKFKGYKSGDKIGVDGSFDVNIWYSYDNDSKTSVINKNIKYNDLFNLKVNDDVSLVGDTEVIVRALKQPSCKSVNIDKGVIYFEIEKDLGVEIVGETKMKISIEDDEEPWDEIVDEIDEKELENIDKNVDTEYLEKK